jgi:hypothetical protein
VIDAIGSLCRMWGARDNSPLEGKRVGVSVGAVGRRVGLEVRPVGAVVGTLVGRMVGAVGGRVGMPVGSAVGNCHSKVTVRGFFWGGG